MSVGSYRALLVANSKFYDDPDLLELKAPIYDMARMQEALTHPATGIFSRERVELLPNAKSADVVRTMDNFFQSCDPDDTLLLYYSGHGKLDLYNDFFLCASDTRLDRLDSTAVKDEQVNAMMRKSPARVFVLVLDCCSSGAWKGTKELLPVPLRGQGRFLLSSSRAGQNSADAAIRTESSPFTRYLVEAITEADVDVDANGYVDIDEIYRYVDRSLTDGGPQQAQRDFDRSAGSVALARRPATRQKKIEPEPTVPIGPLEPLNLNVTPQRIDVTGVRPDDLPVFERIYVFNRGGGELDWGADSDDEWIGLESLGDFAKVTLAPRSLGANRGTVYVRERGGTVERVPVLVDVMQPSIWDRLKKPVLAAGAALAVLALVLVGIAALPDEGPVADGRNGAPSASPVPTERVLRWERESLPLSGGSGRIEAIAASTSGDVPVAAGALGKDAATWVWTEGVWKLDRIREEGEQIINGIPPFDGWLGVGAIGPPGDRDAAAWSVSTTGMMRIPAPELEQPGDQAMYRAQPILGQTQLVAVGEDDGDAGVWITEDGSAWRRPEDPAGELGGTGDQVMLRVEGVTIGGSKGLIAVGYEKIDGNEDGAVWLGDPDGGGWQRVRGTDLPFSRDGDQRIVDVMPDGSGGAIAVGYAESGGGDLDAAVWRSTDGRHWSRSRDIALGGPGDQALMRIRSSGSDELPRIIAVGSDDSNGSLDAALWYSDDGRTWVKQRIEGAGSQSPGSQELLAFGFEGSDVLAVGSDDGSPAIWRGSCTGDHPMCTA
jgi:hypothetical protein